MKATLVRKDGSQLLLEGTPSEMWEMFNQEFRDAPKAFKPVSGVPAESVKTASPQLVPGKRVVSEETRAKIAAAQAKRWAKTRASATGPKKKAVKK